MGSFKTAHDIVPVNTYLEEHYPAPPFSLRGVSTLSIYPRIFVSGLGGCFSTPSGDPTCGLDPHLTQAPHTISTYI
jgi:hypothetical protein